MDAYLKLIKKYKGIDRCLKSICGYIRREKCEVTMELIHVMAAYLLIIKDEWDKNCKGKYIEIEGDTAKFNAISLDAHKLFRQNAYLTNEISYGKHHWCFEFTAMSMYWNIVGLWKTKTHKVPKVDGVHFLSEKNSGYGFIFVNGQLTIPEEPGSNGPQYAGCGVGKKKSFEMYLDMDQLTLSSTAAPNDNFSCGLRVFFLLLQQQQKRQPIVAVKWFFVRVYHLFINNNQ